MKGEENFSMEDFEWKWLIIRVNQKFEPGQNWQDHVADLGVPRVPQKI
jgi:hypothetical protein